MLPILIKGFGTMLVVIDPVGLVPIYLALVGNYPRRERLRIAVGGGLTAAAVLTLFAITGTTILDHLGISIHAFRIAGGLLLSKIAIDMIFTQRKRRSDEEKEEDPDRDSPAVFPLGIPLMAGPGAIATVVILREDLGGGSTGVLWTLACIAAVISITTTSMLLAGAFANKLGQTGINIVTRLLGMLLAALSVQFVADGIRAISTLP